MTEHEQLFRKAGAAIDAAIGKDRTWLHWLKVNRPQHWDDLAETVALAQVELETERSPLDQFGELLALLIRDHLRAHAVWQQRDEVQVAPLVPEFPQAWRN